MAEQAGVEMVVSEPEWTCGRSGNLLLLVWRGHSTVQRAQRVAEATRELARAYPAKGIAVVIVVEPKAPPPEAEARRVFAKVMRENGPLIRGTAYVVPTSGFTGATIRAAITGLSLMAREPYPTEVFAQPERAAVWIAERLGNDWTGARVLAAVALARRG